MTTSPPPPGSPTGGSPFTTAGSTAAPAATDAGEARGRDTGDRGKGQAVSWPAPPLEPGRPPQQVLENLWLFAPNRDSQGGSAWWLEAVGVDLLIDLPALTAANLAFLQERRRGRQAPVWVVATGREGHGRARAWQGELGWPVMVQEQEAYLLPGLADLHTFASEHDLAPGVRLLWTPGPSPGACVLHAAAPALPSQDLLFCGRLLVPLGPGQLGPLRSSRCFHWSRWLRSLDRLRQWLPPGSPALLASGAGLGALRGEKLVADGAALLGGLDLMALATREPGG